MTTHDFVPKYHSHRPGLSDADNEILDRVIRVGAEVRQLSLWCMYNARWAKEAVKRGEKIA